MFLHALVLNISAIITAASYPLVVRLYRLFEYICTFKLLHEDFIHSVWNNIYIFVAVIVLFAIAIKLISAMVNPDLLTDSKKGAKSYYFRAVAAVILIFLVPIVFEKSFEIQEELLTKNMLSSHVFGYKVEEGTNLGQIFAWEGFSAFCLPDKASQDKIDNKYLSIRADMDNINSVMNEIRLQKSTKYALPTLIVLNDNQWEYHSILCPLVGLLLVYEMVLLCMDTLFRAAKLAFLQIMTPIVLGAFVFDPSILKKWAKEFFSTYISLFLKVLAMYFIAITISQIQAEIAKTDFYNGDWLLTGLFKILLIIALLQLAKKIPDLINKIFGLEIKLRGGIKGRLGEMAGIGGIAQKAWTSLGGYAKGLGAASLYAGGAAIGFGAKKGFDAIANTKGKAGELARALKTGYGKLKNGNAGRFASTFAAGVKTKGKGTGRAMLDTWNKNPLTASSVKAQQIAANQETNKILGLSATGGAEYDNSDYNIPFKRNTKGDSTQETQREISFYDGKRKVAESHLKDAASLANNLGISNDTTERILNRGVSSNDVEKQRYALSQMQKGKGIIEQAASNALNDDKAKIALTNLANSVGLDAMLFTTDANGKTISKTTADYIKDVLEKIKSSKYDYSQYFGNEPTMIAALTALAEGASLTYNTPIRSIGNLDKTTQSADKQIKDLEEIILSGLPNTGNQAENERMRQDVKAIFAAQTQWAKEQTEAESKVVFIGSDYGQKIAYSRWDELLGTSSQSSSGNNATTQTVNNITVNNTNNNTNNNISNNANNNTNNNINNNANNSTNSNTNNASNNPSSDSEGNSGISAKDKNDIINAINNSTEDNKINLGRAVESINSNTDGVESKISEQQSKIQTQLDDIEKKNKDKDNE